MKTKNEILLANVQELLEVYEAPVIETVEVKSEQGFASSPRPSSPGSPGNDEDNLW